MGTRRMMTQDRACVALDPVFRSEAGISRKATVDRKTCQLQKSQQQEPIRMMKAANVAITIYSEMGMAKSNSVVRCRRYALLAQLIDRK